MHRGLPWVLLCMGVTVNAAVGVSEGLAVERSLPYENVPRAECGVAMSVESTPDPNSTIYLPQLRQAGFFKSGCAMSRKTDDTWNNVGQDQRQAEQRSLEEEQGRAGGKAKDILKKMVLASQDPTTTTTATATSMEHSLNPKKGERCFLLFVAALGAHSVHSEIDEKRWPSTSTSTSTSTTTTAASSSKEKIHPRSKEGESAADWDRWSNIIIV